MESLKNKKVQIVICLILIINIGIFIFKKPSLNTPEKKASYALGYQIATNFKNQNIDYDPEILAHAIKDVMKNNDSLMSSEEIQQALEGMQKGMATKRQDQQAKAISEAASFMEKNKSKSGVVTSKSGLQYIVEKEGSGSLLKPTDVITAHFKIMNKDGDVLDSTKDRNQAAEFRIDTLIQGWREGAQIIKKGGKIKLFIPPELAYGTTVRAGIPAHSVLIIEMEIL